jgi:hypothetical protein
MEPNYAMTVNNKEIWEFFHENPTVDFESAILVLIDIFDMTMKNAETTMNNKMNTRILSSITDQMNQLKDLRTDIGNLKQDLSKFNTEILSSLFLKFSDIKKEYVEEMKTILTFNGVNSLEKITSMVDKNNLALVDKTKLLLTEIVPRTNDAYYRQIQENIQQFQKNIIEETTKLLSGSQNENSVQDFLGNFELKFTSMAQSVQSPIYNFITASEERINKNLTQIKDHTINKDAAHEKLFNELDDFLNKNKYKNSTVRGKTGENQLEDILNQMFPSAMVKNTSGIPASGDFILQERELGKKNILFENKHYTSNVNSEEVLKFHRDVREQRCNGIMLSQTSGIVSKKPFQIEIIDSLIVVYVLNCEYDPDKIKIAVDMIDTLSHCLSSYIERGELGENNTISTEIMNQINEEYGKFSLQKLAFIENLKIMSKEMTKKLTEQIEDMKMPTLNHFLSAKFGNYNVSSSTDTDNALTCKYCKKVWATKASLASHMKGCVKKAALKPNTDG